MNRVKSRTPKGIGLWGFALLWITFGCGPAPQPKPLNLEEPVNLDNTVGNLARMVQFNAVPVRGFGIVAGLNGTGSSECPPALRSELEKYIRQQLPNTKDLDPRRFLDSPNTAVVEINGVIPELADRGQSFDLQIIPFSRSQTTSLDGGFLYTAPLKERSTFIRYDQYAKTFAVAEGQIFRNTLDEEKADQWYLLGGGIVRNEVQLSLALLKPNFNAANTIRNRLNERFGSGTAKAVSAAEVRIQIPSRYKNQKTRFLQMVLDLYLSDDPALCQKHMQTLITQISSPADRERAEAGLEAIGKLSLDLLHPLLASKDSDLRFFAARCMLNIGDERAMPALEEFCKDTTSPWCIPAIQAIGQAARPRKAEPVLLKAIESSNLQIRLAAYEQLDLIRSPAISRTMIADSFLLDRVFCGGPPLIYVCRSQVPKIILFANPIQCRPDIFFQSDDGAIILNAKPEDKLISVSRRHPARPRVIGPVQCGRELSLLIRTLGETADVSNRPGLQPGLAIPYQEIILLLKKLAEKDLVTADFQAGPMTQAGSFLQNLPENDR
jgi:hypothetical protein